MQYVLLAVLAGVLLWFVIAPFRRAPASRDHRARDAEARVQNLQIRKESKYREIRDAQLDHASGKLTDGDFAELDGELRREAMTILAELDRAEAERQLEAR